MRIHALDARRLSAPARLLETIRQAFAAVVSGARGWIGRSRMAPGKVGFASALKHRATARRPRGVLFLGRSRTSIDDSALHRKDTDDSENAVAETASRSVASPLISGAESRSRIASAMTALTAGKAWCLRAVRGIEQAVTRAGEPRGFRWLVLGIALAVLPALALLFSLHAGSVLIDEASASASAESSGPRSMGVLVLATGLGGLAALYALGLAVLWWRSLRRTRELAGDNARLVDRVHGLDAANRDAREETELLAALREVTRALARETEVEGVLEDVVGILAGYLDPKSLELYLPEPEPDGVTAPAPAPITASAIGPAPMSATPAIATIGGATRARLSPPAQQPPKPPPTLKPHAVLAGDRVLVGAALDADERSRLPAPPVVERCRTTGAILCRLDLDATRATLTLPIESGSPTPGVLHVTCELDGATTEQRETAAKRVERRLTQFIRHVALTVKHLTLYDRAVMDGLTRLYNRRAGEERVQAAYALAVRNRSPIGVVMCDIDHFKLVNDTHGHAAGDHVLTGVAQVIRRIVREADIVFRYGGEEIAICCPSASADEASQTAERIRVAIAEAQFRGKAGAPLNVTCSFGVAATGENDGEHEPLAELVARADAALYESKDGGRDRVTRAAAA